MSYILRQVGGTVLDSGAYLAFKLTQKAYCPYRFTGMNDRVKPFNFVKHSAVIQYAK